MALIVYFDAMAESNSWHDEAASSLTSDCKQNSYKRWLRYLTQLE